jgi:chromosome segregation ATPase
MTGDGLRVLLQRAALAQPQAIDLAELAGLVLSTQRMRELCQRFDLRPRGFRIERADRLRLLPRLMEGCRERDEVRAALAAEIANTLATPPAAKTEPNQGRLSELLESRIAGLSKELQRTREAGGRRQHKVEELSAQLQQLRAENLALPGERSR